jgi:hypothetical protein
MATLADRHVLAGSIGESCEACRSFEVIVSQKERHAWLNLLNVSGGEFIIACETYEFMLGEAGTVVTVVVAVWIIERRRSTVHGCCEPSFLSESQKRMTG